MPFLLTLDYYGQRTNGARARWQPSGSATSSSEDERLGVISELRIVRQSTRHKATSLRFIRTTMTNNSSARETSRRTPSPSSRSYLIVFLSLVFIECSAFAPSTRCARLTPASSPVASVLVLRTSADNGENESSSSVELEPPLDDLKPPLINWRKESILFGENPATQKNNNALRLWRALKSCLPPVVTGARQDTTADENPMGALFNMMFIRIPTIIAGFCYGLNLSTGHPLVMDLGSGPFEMNPLVVAGVFYILLL